MTYQEILEDAQEIKRRLLALGENVDENTICELLQSSGPDYKVEHIISMITNNWNTDQSSLVETGTSVIDLSSVIDKSETQYNNVIIHTKIESTQEEYFDMSDSSSNYDDSDDYYASTNLDDISAVDTVTRSIPSPLEPCDNTSSSNHNDSEAMALPTEVECLEENNNDPNNNLDSAQILQELHSNSVDMEVVKKPDSPKPGCSKDSNDTFVSHKYSKLLHTEADQINVLLPRLKRNIIYKTLRHNCNAKNRVELTLWDLLPEKRPKPQISSKRKLSDDVYYVGSKINITELSDDDDDTEVTYVDSVKPQAAHKKHSHVKKYTIVEVPDENTSADASQQNVVTTEKSGIQEKNSTKVVQHEANKAVAENNCTTVHEEPSTSSGRQVLPQSTVRHEEPSTSAANNVQQSKSIVNTVTSESKVDKSDNNIDTCNISDKEKPVSSEINIKSETLQLNTESSVVQQKEGASGTVHDSRSTTILRPPKLTFISNIERASLKPSFLPALILSPPKLKISRNNDQVSTQIIRIPAQNPKKVISKQNTDEHMSLGTSANKRNIQASDGVSIVQSHATANLTENNLSVSRDKTLSNVETGSIKLSETNMLHNLQPNSTKPIIVKPIIVNSSKSEVKNSGQGGNGFSKSQVMPSTSKVATNVIATKPVGTINRMQTSSGGQQVLSQPIVVRHEANNAMAENNYTIVHEKPSTSSAASNVQQGHTKEQKPTNNNTSGQTVILNKTALNIYYKLIPMFPCVDTKYIKRLCYNSVKDDALLVDETELLQDLIEYLLNHSQEHPNVKKPESPPLPQTFSLDEQYGNLLDIFPKADPKYLRDKAKQMYNDPDMMKEFVQSKLEKPDYPTREQYLAKKKITEQQKQYTAGFQVSQFLEIFPDPFSHFEDDKRKCTFDTYAADFLKHHFNKIRVNTLLNIYSQCKYNLSLTAKTLENLNPDMKSKRICSLIQTENIPILQECAFILHKAELRAYLNELKEKEDKEFNELKAKNALLECQCCYDSECMPSQCSTCTDGHIFCNSCIAKCTDVKLAEGETHIQCLIDCGSEFHLSVLQRILPPTKFSILLQKRQEAEIMAAGLEGLVSCPFCHFASIPPQEDKVFKCLNPDCMKESCRLCKEINHLPLKCNEKKSDAARLYLEEKMSEALIRKCYRCARTFIKEEGCNKMTCICGAQMCYICDKPISNYGHFRGQGSTEPNLCPLWSDDRRMNAEAVIHVCKETMKQIREKDPEIEINTDALLPMLPPKARGPHDDVAHANVLPAHANRIVRHIP